MGRIQMEENIYLYLQFDRDEYIEVKNGIINVNSHWRGRAPLIDKIENFILVSFYIRWKRSAYVTMMHIPSDIRYLMIENVIKKGELENYEQFRDLMQQRGQFLGLGHYTGYATAKNPLKEQQRREAEAAAQAALEEAQRPVLIACPCCGREVSNQAPACPVCGQPIAKAACQPQGMAQEKEFHGVYRVGLLGKKTEVHCPRCGSENCSIYKEQKIIPGKSKLEYKKNLNPLKPFTAGTVKEKVIREDQIVTEDKFMCNSCGKIFR